MNKFIWLPLLLAAYSGAWAIDLPSDDDLVRRGREHVNGFMPKIDSNPAPPAPISPVGTPEHLTPLQKQMMQESLETRMPTAKQIAAKKAGQVDLVVFVSFSMPDAMLESYSKQAKEAGAVLVLRGLVDGSVRKTQARAAQVNPAIADWEINPGLYRKFKVNKVPAIVLVDDSKAEADQNGCAQPAAYLSVAGDISIRQALSTMGWQGNGHLAALAKQKLQSIEEN